MLIFLYGQDVFRSRQKLNEIIKKYEKLFLKEMSLLKFDNRKNAANSPDKELISFPAFLQTLRSPSLFKEKKIIVLVDIFSDNEFKKELTKREEWLAETGEVIVFYETNVPKKNDGFLKFLLKNAKCQEFETLSGEKLKQWAKLSFEKYGAKIDSLALNDLLANSGGEDLFGLSNEIKKLSCFKRHGIVNREDVKILTKERIETGIFKAVDFLVSGKKKDALELFHKHLQKGDSPFYLFIMIAFQFRNLLVVKSLSEKYSFSEILQKSKLHPFVARKSLALARNFTLSQLKRIYQRLFETDLRIKKGAVSPETAIDLTVSGL